MRRLCIGASHQFVYLINCVDRKFRSGNLVADLAQAGMLERNRELSALLGNKALAESVYLDESPTGHQQRCYFGPPNVATAYSLLSTDLTLLMAANRDGLCIV